MNRPRPTLQGGSTEKQEMAKRQERKRRDMLNSLKSLTGPFTDAVEVEST